MLVRHFLSRLSSHPRADDRALGRQLEKRVRSAKARWPGVAIPSELFAVRLGEIVAVEGVGLRGLHTDDLWLALACLARDPHAESAFERDIIAGVRPSIERVVESPVAVDDILQNARAKLLMGSSHGAAPKLSQYTAKGPLEAWVRVVAVREALYAQRVQRRERAADESELLAPSNRAMGLELEVLRARHGEAFRASVHDALRRLTSEQRALLRFHVRDGLSIDRLAPMLGVHRATAARRLATARAEALAHTRALLREHSGVSESEARSLCLALASEVDVSIGRALSETTAR